MPAPPPFDWRQRPANTHRLHFPRPMPDSLSPVARAPESVSRATAQQQVLGPRAAPTCPPHDRAASRILRGGTTDRMRRVSGRPRQPVRRIDRSISPDPVTLSRPRIDPAHPPPPPPPPPTRASTGVNDVGPGVRSYFGGLSDAMALKTVVREIPPPPPPPSPPPPLSPTKRHSGQEARRSGQGARMRGPGAPARARKRAARGQSARKRRPEAGRPRVSDGLD